MRNRPAASLHPAPGQLALYVSDDLLWRYRVRLRWHLSRCRGCQEEVSAFRAALNRVEAAPETQDAPEGIRDWSRLQREMAGNIAVGLAAARCIEKVGHTRRLAWRGGTVVITLCVLFAAGWLTHIPREQNEHLLASLQRFLSSGRRSPWERPEVLVSGGAQAIAIRANGTTLSLLHPSTAAVSVYGSSGLSARYLDEESGQVTITTVYGH